VVGYLGYPGFPPLPLILGLALGLGLGVILIVNIVLIIYCKCCRHHSKDPEAGNGKSIGKYIRVFLLLIYLGQTNSSSYDTY
jgi:hypothetical protein